MARKRPLQKEAKSTGSWPLLAVNFFMADMQSGIGPFVGVFLASQVATSVAGAAIVPAVTGITLGMVGQRGFNRQNGRNQAFNHAGNMVGAALSGLLGWLFGYFSVFLLSALFGAITVACVLLIPSGSIDDRAARGSKEDDPESQPSGLTVLLKHKALLVLALALAVFHLGNAAIVPLYGMSAVSNNVANGPSFVATIIVIAQGVMVIASVVAMHVAEKRNYWLIMLGSFLVLPLRGMFAYFLTGWWGVVPVEILDGIGIGLLSVAVPGMVARSLYGTGRVNLAQGAVITIQGGGAAFSPALGGWIAQWIGFSSTFLVLGGLGLAAAALWIVLGAAVKQY